MQILAKKIQQKTHLFRLLAHFHMQSHKKIPHLRANAGFLLKQKYG